MAVASLALNLASSTTTLPKKLKLPTPASSPKPSAFSLPSTITCSRNTSCIDEDRNCKKRPLLLGVGALALSLLPASSLLAEELPANYSSFVDKVDGYSYIYPSDWTISLAEHYNLLSKMSLTTEDTTLHLKTDTCNCKMSFIPTEKSDIREMGSLQEYIPGLLKRAYTAPNKRVTIFDMQERTTDDKNYYTFEYTLTSRNYSRAAFATIAVANGRYYTLAVGANTRRWKRVGDQLKVVADSFKVLDI